MLVVNLFAGPGAGKSTLAAATFAALKAAGVSAELVTEFAKDCTWEGRTGPLRCQPYVFGEQLWRMERLRDRGVEIAVTDSPILLSLAYTTDAPDAFEDVVWHYHHGFQHINVLLTRVKPYDHRGRFQKEDEAVLLDAQIKALVGYRDDIHFECPGDPAMAPVVAWLARHAAGLVPPPAPEGAPYDR